MSTVVVMTLISRPDCYSSLAKLVQEMNPAVVNWKGCLSVRAAGDLASNTITVWEHWDSIESHDSYFAWRAERGDVDKYFLPLLGAAPSSQVLTSLF